MRRTTEVPSAAKNTWTTAWLSPWRLLIAAVIFHIVVTTTIYGLGHYEILPGTFDTGGIAVSIAPDGLELRKEANQLSDDLSGGKIRNWLIAPLPFHIKLYSISFALLRPWFGSTILCAEPLNALCYVAILVLIVNLGRETFNRRAGFIAAATVALWPSFLLHTTQLLKDPLFLVGMLALFLLILRLLSTSYSWVRALLTGTGGGLIAIFIWIERDNMGEILIATAALGGAMLIVRQFWERDFHAANLVGMALLVVMSAGVTRVVPKTSPVYDPDKAEKTSGNGDVSPDGRALQGSATRLPEPTSRIAARIMRTRRAFVLAYKDSGSNIDSDRRLTSTWDIVRFLPRAAAIGFFAPFPNMWIATGNRVGSAGRLLSGLETMAMYVIEALAFIGLWSGGRGPRRWSVWLLGLFAAMGLISLGLVVVNVGALYRLRYVFLILVIVLATEGAAQSFHWYKKKRLVGSRLTADV